MKFYRLFLKSSMLVFLLVMAETQAITLKDTLEQGLIHNTLLQKQNLGTQAVKEQLREVRSTTLPKIYAEIAYSKMNSFQTRQFTESLSSSGFGALFDTIDELTTTTNVTPLNFDTSNASSIQNSYTTKITFTQTLFNGQALPALSAAKEYIKIQENTAKLTELQVLISITQAYLNLQQSELAQEFAYKSLDSFKTHANYVKLRREQGLATNAEVLQSQVALKNSEQVLINTSKNLAVAQLELNHLLKNREVFHAESLLKLPKVEAVVLHDLYETAVQNRLDLNSQQRLIQAKKKAIDVAKRKGWPTVSLVGSYGFGSTETFTVNQNAEDWFVGITGTHTFFDGFYNSAQKKQAKYDLKNVKLDETVLLETIEKDCVESFLNFQSAQKAFLASKDNLTLSEELLTLEHLGYESGTASLRDLLDAQAGYLKANLQYNQHFYDVITRYLQLEYHLGTLTLDKVLALEKK